MKSDGLVNIITEQMIDNLMYAMHGAGLIKFSPPLSDKDN